MSEIPDFYSTTLIEKIRIDSAVDEGLKGNYKHTTVQVQSLAILLDIARAAVDIDNEGYVESMQNVPSWQRLAVSLDALQAMSADS